MLPTIHIQTSILAHLFGRISNQRWLTPALKASYGISACCFRSTDVWSSSAFIDVYADGSCCFESWSTPACSVFTTLSVVGTVEIWLAPGADFGSQAAGTTVALVTGRTFADISGNPVYTFCTRAALVKSSGRAFIGICGLKNSFCLNFLICWTSLEYLKFCKIQTGSE